MVDGGNPNGLMFLTPFAPMQDSMFDHSSTPSDLPQDDFCSAVPSLPIDKRHLEQLLEDVVEGYWDR